MVRWAYVLFMSDEKTGFIHPCGDGRRKLLVIEREDDTVTALYPPTLEAADYSGEVWRSFRPELESIEFPSLVQAKLVRRRDEMKRLGVAIAQAETQETIDLLRSMLPPPRVRTRTAPPFPLPVARVRTRQSHA